jgi:hypothetical protein
VMTGALPDLSMDMLTLLAPERRRGWKEAPGAKAVAEATTAAKAMTLVDMDSKCSTYDSRPIYWAKLRGVANLDKTITGLF